MTVDTDVEDVLRHVEHLPRLDRLPDDDDEQTSPGSTHGDHAIEGRLLRKIIRPIIEDETNRAMGPVAELMRTNAELMRRDADRMDRLVSDMREIVVRVADYAQEMHEDRRHIEAARKEHDARITRNERRIELIARAVFPDGLPEEF